MPLAALFMGGVLPAQLCSLIRKWRWLYELKGNMKVSPMSEEFHDWLDQCPVQWFRGEVTTDHVTYSFETPDEEEED